MNEAFDEMKIKDFIEVLESKAPVPGGGGASALVGALAMSLGDMVGSLTVGKKKYADVEDQVKELMKRGQALTRELLVQIDEDAKAFEPLSKIYGLPKDTKEQAEYKERVMEEALVEASKVPMTIMKKCSEAIDLIGEFARIGSVIALSDAGVAATFAISALKGAALNVFINTRLMKNKEVAKELNDKANAMIEEYSLKAEKVYSDVRKRLEA